MNNPVDLWVCPNCDVLMGIQFDIEGPTPKTLCLSCGVSLDPKDVHFIDIGLSTQVQQYLSSQLPKDLLEDIRYSWVSRKTLGIIFDLERDEVIKYISMDDLEEIENELESRFAITSTYYFE